MLYCFSIIIIGLFIILYAVDMFNTPIEFKIKKSFINYVIYFKTKLGLWHKLREVSSNGIDFDSTYTVKFKTLKKAKRYLLLKDIDESDKDYKKALKKLNKEFKLK